jgi:Subtilase family
MASPIPVLHAISLRPNEIVLGNVAVTLDAARAFDRDIARKGLGVAGVEGAVRFRDGGKRAVWTPRRPLAPGRYRFVLGELASASGKRLSTAGDLHFAVAQSRARIPTSVAIESMVRMRVDRFSTQRLSLFAAREGRYIEVMKGVDRRTEAPVSLAFDQSGKRIDAEQVLARIEVARAKEFGRMHESLFKVRQNAKANSRLPVAVWFNTDASLLEVSRSMRSQKQRPQTAVRQRAQIERATKDGVSFIEQHDGRVRRVSKVAPVVFADLSATQLDRMARNPSVAGLFLHDPRGIEDLDDSMAIANSDDVHTLGIRGAGIRVAVWEDGPDSTANLAIAGRFTTSPATSDHSRHVHGIIRNTQVGLPRGHARSCRLFSANDMDLDALEWAVDDQECTVINQSFHRRDEAREGTLSFDDIYKDWIALRWPFPMICQAAGNHFEGDDDDIDPTTDEYANHKGFNSLAVANHNDDATAMSSSSVFRNPISSHGDRELPEISANGTSVTAVGLTKSGTSMASPACAGVAALIQNTNATLQHWPEGCRAILLAGASRNVVDQTWWEDVVDDVDASDGSGAVNALESHRIAGQHRARNAAASRRGWDVGSLRSADFDRSGLSHFSYRIQVPRGVFAPRRVKVALAWTSKVSTFSILGMTIPLSSKLTVDLDLKVFDANGAQVGYSGSWDNSYEIAEFTGLPGQTYTIRIRRWSGTDSVWYGIAWTVTGGLFILQEAMRTDLQLR